MNTVAHKVSFSDKFHTGTTSHTHILLSVLALQTKCLMANLMHLVAKPLVLLAPLVQAQIGFVIIAKSQDI